MRGGLILIVYSVESLKAAILGLKGGRRTRSRPRLCYTDNVKEGLKPSSLKEAVALAQQRGSWRGLIGKVSYSVADRHLLTKALMMMMIESLSNPK